MITEPLCNEKPFISEVPDLSEDEKIAITLLALKEVIEGAIAEKAVGIAMNVGHSRIARCSKCTLHAGSKMRSIEQARLCNPIFADLGRGHLLVQPQIID